MFDQSPKFNASYMGGLYCQARFVLWEFLCPPHGRSRDLLSGRADPTPSYGLDYFNLVQLHCSELLGVKYYPTVRLFVTTYGAVV